LILDMEGVDLGSGFDGFFLNKDNPSLGKHKGQVGQVKASEWAFTNGETKGGVKVSRDKQILVFMKQLCTSLNILSWLDDQDNKHDTIESLVKAFSDEKPFKDKYLMYCICGKEYTNKQNYVSYELFLPKFTKSGVPFEPVDANPSKLLKLSEAEHIKKKDSGSNNKASGPFGNESANTKGGDFNLD